MLVSEACSMPLFYLLVIISLSVQASVALCLGSTVEVIVLGGISVQSTVHLLPTSCVF